MLHDYYVILGVPPTADLAVIRQAYRKKATVCHPDHGGSHAQMLLVNEAWSILSNPQSRARYDESRQQPNSEAAKAFSREDAPQARRQAAEYPRDWNQFEDWLDIVAADFSRARYGKVAGGVWGTVWPTSKDSLSAAVFLWGGGTVGVLTGLLIYRLCLPRTPGIIMSLRLLLMGSALFACGGAWIGCWLHGLLRALLGPSSSPTPVQKETDMQKNCVIRCPQCSQQLKLPRIARPLAVTCGKCRHQFDLPPSVVG